MPSKSESISDVADILNPQDVPAGEPQTQTSIKVPACVVYNSVCKRYPQTFYADILCWRFLVVFSLKLAFRPPKQLA